MYRGREMRHKELGTRVLDRLVEDLKGVGKVERTPLLEGRFMTMVFSPDREGIRKIVKEAEVKKKAAAASGPASPPGFTIGRRPCSRTSTISTCSGSTEAQAPQPVQSWFSATSRTFRILAAMSLIKFCCGLVGGWLDSRPVGGAAGWRHVLSASVERRPRRRRRHAGAPVYVSLPHNSCVGHPQLRRRAPPEPGS